VRKCAAGVVVVGLLLAGCGGSGDKARRHDAVDRYFAQLVKAQTPLAADVATLNEAYRHLLTKHMRKRDLRSVALAEQQLASVRENIGRITPPPDARAIHENVVRLVDLDLAVARDLRWMTRYLPQLRGALAPLAPASTGLRKALKAAHGWRAERAALTAYCAKLRTADQRVGALSAPPEFGPSLAGERGVLHRSLQGCAVVQKALTRKNTKLLNAGLNTLAGASYGSDAARASTAERSAILAYNRRLVQIRALAAAIYKQRQRLQKRLG
jgi:hypothetical protein